MSELTSLVESAVNTVYPRYSRWVERQDVSQELQVWVLTDPASERFRDWIATEQFERVERRLIAYARKYCEREKAVRLGYSPDDVHWYTPGSLRPMIEPALNSEWEGIRGQSDEEGRGKGVPSETGSFLAKVMDVRRALDAVAGRYVLLTEDETSDVYADVLADLADWLNGQFPDDPSSYRSRRTAISNAQAQAMTSNQEAGE